MPALYINLMPKDQDLGYQRSSRPEQPDQRRPNKAARFPHRTEALRDSASAVSPIRFTTGTGVDDKGHAYIIEDRTAKFSPEAWAREAISAFRKHRADRIVAEVNKGGDLVE